MKFKLILTVTVILLFSSCLTGGYDSTELSKEEMTVSKIIELESSKDDLYVSSNLWLAEYFKSAEAVIEVQDKEAGLLMGKGMISSSNFFGTNYFRFTVKIETKENKARISLIALDQTTDVSSFASGSYTPSTSYISATTWNDYLKAEFGGIMGKYKKYISNYTTSDW